jgi:hypothetical protein
MTRTRVMYLLLAAFIAVLATAIARNTYWGDETVYKPPKGEAATDPYYATRKLLGQLGVNIQDASSLRALPRQDAVLIIEALSDIEWREHRVALQQWVGSGGRLVVPASTIFDNTELQAWTGLSMAPALDEAGVRRLRNEPCQTLDVRVDGKPNGESLRACVSEPETAALSKRVPTWSLSNAAGLQIMRLRLGEGSLTILDCDCLLKRGKILTQDHARVIVEAIGLRRGDAVTLLRAADSESLLALLWRLAAPAMLASAAIIGLLIWRHWPRFGPPEPAALPVRRSLAEQIRANAQFAWRTRQLASLRNVMRRAVERLARRRVAAFQRLDSQQRFGTLAARTGLDAAALRAAMTDAAGGDAQSQAAAIELLERARRALDEQPSRPQGDF